jgi:hypothetical protein
MDTILTASIIGGVFGITTALINKGFFTPNQGSYDQDAQVEAFVQLLGHKYGCQRLTIVGYHNGGEWYDGTSIKKFTVRHEYYNANLAEPVQLLMQGVSTGVLKDMPDYLDKHWIIFERDLTLATKEKLYKPTFFKAMQEYGTNATIVVAIKRRLFNWRKLRYEIKMVASIHLNWVDDSWTSSFIDLPEKRLRLCNDLNLLSTMFDRKHIRNDVNTLVDRIITTYYENT